MNTPAVLFVCILVTCSVWTVHGRSFEINTDDQEMEVEVSMKVSKLPGICWACKWAVKKVKKIVGQNATSGKLEKTLKNICNEIGFLKSMCHKFVKKHLSELIEELTTTDDVSTICVNTGACRPKELSQLIFYPKHEDYQTETDFVP